MWEGLGTFLSQPSGLPFRLSLSCIHTGVGRPRPGADVPGSGSVSAEPGKCRAAVRQTQVPLLSCPPHTKKITLSLYFSKSKLLVLVFLLSMLCTLLPQENVDGKDICLPSVLGLTVFQCIR